jgi:molecular chaperone Hsp33
MAKDWLARFHLEQAGVRGVIARLDETWREVVSHAPYPEPVAALLGETLAASALFAGDIKMTGTISLQLKGKGALSLVFAECTAQGELRGLARYDGSFDAPIEPRSLGPDALLAITIEREDAAARYQGLVPLEGERFADAFEAYFAQSEQLPTAIRLVVGPDVCAGMLVQQIAGAGGHSLRDATSEYERVSLMFRTLKDEELATLAPEVLLRRLFSEDDVRLHRALPLRFGCRCSRARVATMLRTLGREEALASRLDDGVVEVQCQFCNRQYRFDAADLEAVFTEKVAVQGPSTPQ